MRLSVLAILALILALPFSARATETTVRNTGKGMKTITMSPLEARRAAAEKSKQPVIQKSTDAPKKKRPAKKALKKAEVEKAEKKPELTPEPKKDTESNLVGTDKLKPWAGMADLFAGRASKESAKKAITAFESEPGKVPPYGLFLVANSYYDQGNMALAARYYYAAQLRARFDYFRWPGKGSGNDNPYINLSNLSHDLAPKIGAWALHSSDRFAEILDDVKAWDEKTSYAYYPGYKLPEKAPEEKEWPALLANSRETFFQDSTALVSALKAMGK